MIEDKNIIFGQNPLQERQKKMVFNLLKAQVVRSRVTMTAVFLRIQVQEESIPDEEIGRIIDTFLVSKIRQTDVLIEMGELERCILLSHSKEGEAHAFLRRLYFDFKEENELITPLTFVASIAEINNRHVEYDELIVEGRNGLAQALQQGDYAVQAIEKFKNRETEVIKVSILENNDIFSNVLYASLQNLSLPYFELEIQQFKDGDTFLQSDFIRSSHQHLVITNDILPRANGLKVVYTLRQMPNEKKFNVFMMTKRKSEADMLHAYAAGVDEYLVKPFNIRLFEVQIKRTFERFWS